MRRQNQQTQTVREAQKRTGQRPRRTTARRRKKESQLRDNVCERSVRPFTTLRKNFGGFGGENGATSAATYLTMVETCKLRGNSPKDFFRGFFDYIVAGNEDYDARCPPSWLKKYKTSTTTSYKNNVLEPQKRGFRMMS